MYTSVNKNETAIQQHHMGKWHEDSDPDVCESKIRTMKWPYYYIKLIVSGMGLNFCQITSLSTLNKKNETKWQPQFFFV